jgi:hypothetical protein
MSENLNDTDVFYPEEILFQIKDRKYYIRPVVLKQRILIVRELSHVVDEWRGVSTDGQLKTSTLIEIAGEKLVGIYSIVLNETEDWLLNNLTAAKEVELLEIIMKLNDITFLVERVKSLIDLAMAPTK